MQANELTDLVAGLSALAERFERRMQQVELDLKHLTRQVPDAIRESADTETRHLRESVMAQIDAGLQQPVSAYQQRLQEDSRHLQQAAQALSVQIHRMQALHRHLI